MPWCTSGIMQHMVQVVYKRKASKRPERLLVQVFTRHDSILTPFSRHVPGSIHVCISAEYSWVTALAAQVRPPDIGAILGHKMQIGRH
jgi:hypothetical protein